MQAWIGRTTRVKRQAIPAADGTAGRNLPTDGIRPRVASGHLCCKNLAQKRYYARAEILRDLSNSLPTAPSTCRQAFLVDAARGSVPVLTDSLASPEVHTRRLRVVLSARGIL
jgi:hypothetical protein